MTVSVARGRRGCNGSAGHWVVALWRAMWDEEVKMHASYPRNRIVPKWNLQPTPLRFDRRGLREPLGNEDECLALFNHPEVGLVQPPCQELGIANMVSAFVTSRSPVRNGVERSRSVRGSGREFTTKINHTIKRLRTLQADLAKKAMVNLLIAHGSKANRIFGRPAHHVRKSASDEVIQLIFMFRPKGHNERALLNPEIVTLDMVAQVRDDAPDRETLLVGH